MKTYMLLIPGLLFLHASSFAQSGKSSSRYSQQETVIINRDQGASTTIELKSDGLYLNGEQVASRAELSNRNLHKRIVIRNNKNSNDRSYEEYYNSDRENTTERRAVLGVFTDARKSGDGAYIDRVSPNSAAEKAGLRRGDVILRVDTVNIYNAEDLTRTIRRYEPNDRVNIVFNRNGRERQTTAALGEVREQSWSRVYEYPQDLDPMPPVTRSFPFDNDAFNDRKPRLGVSVEDAANGVRIRTVREGSPAEEAGLKAGDIITYMDNQKVSTIQDVQQIVNNTRSGSKLKVEINRNGNRITRTVSFPDIENVSDL